MRLRASVILGLACIVFSISAAEAKILKPSKIKCASIGKVIKKKRLHYAYVRNTPDRKGGYACGYGWGLASKKLAEKSALDLCKREEKIPPPIGRRGTCRIVFSK